MNLDHLIFPHTNPSIAQLLFFLAAALTSAVIGIMMRRKRTPVQVPIMDTERPEAAPGSVGPKPIPVNFYFVPTKSGKMVPTLLIPMKGAPRLPRMTARQIRHKYVEETGRLVHPVTFGEMIAKMRKEGLLPVRGHTKAGRLIYGTH